VKRPATQKQKDFMDHLGLEYDEDITLEDAKIAISDELEMRENVRDCNGGGMDWWKD